MLFAPSFAEQGADQCEDGKGEVAKQTSQHVIQETNESGEVVCRCCAVIRIPLTIFLRSRMHASRGMPAHNRSDLSPDTLIRRTLKSEEGLR